MHGYYSSISVMLEMVLSGYSKILYLTLASEINKKIIN